ncbi:hypothetical protein FOA43_001876 [Brettanomyces nanus]|uniref:Uncharacterized protein n=1 Tax=Eeniella nana TaxID=13502 RepID=A0A875S2I2_EENNA|nr:uncharacterized protein FOA43_001876 [Brettanomyces nanus]QPG74545.1 hypothetical protein FOA43_001876 [Brettanomyces nanus]
MTSNRASKRVSSTLVGVTAGQPEKEIVEDALFRQYLQELSEESSPMKLLNGYNTWFPGVDMSEENAFFYNAFAKGFMVSVSPQLAHKNLQISAVFIPPGISNPILRSVFYACGAAFLCWRRKDMCQIAEKKYEQCLSMVSRFIDKKSIIGNESWLLVALLCFCLREKYHGEDVTLNTCHLVAALEIIRLWQANKRRIPGFLKSLAPQKHAQNKLLKQSSGRSILQGIYGKLEERTDDSDSGSDNFFCLDDEVSPASFSTVSNNLQQAQLKNATIFHQLIGKMRPQLMEEAESIEREIRQDCSSPSDSEDACISISKVGMSEISSHFMPGDQTVDACERTLLESFLYNYTINLFICDKNAVEYLASPFDVFKAFKDFLSPRIYDCPVPWMNNPVMGASLPAFEIAAKTNWLALQYPLSEKNRKLAVLLMKSAKYYALPVLPANIKAREPKNVQRRLMESCYMGGMVSKASFIFLKKLLNPDIQGSDSEIVETVESFNKDLFMLTLHSQISAICAWPMAIVGVAAVQQEHRDYLVWRINNFCDVVRSEASSTVLKYWEVIWGEEKDGLRALGSSLDALLDRRYLKYLFI